MVDFLRKQYLGYIPLTTQERFSTILRQAFIDSNTAYNDLRYIEKQKNDLSVQEERLKIETESISDSKSLFASQDMKQIKESMTSWIDEKKILQLSVSIPYFKLNMSLDL